MAALGKVKCPVCRARQAPQPVCRRCSADLSLYLKALDSQDYARRLHAAALRSGDRQAAEQSAAYLRWLKPQADRIE